MARIALFFLLGLVAAAKADDGALSDFLLGKYALLGQALDADTTYRGQIELYREQKGLKFKRHIADRVVIGDATLEAAANGEAKVLRLRFAENGVAYEETCVWGSDLDNYPRITCHLYRPGMVSTRPGLEAWFHDHQAD